MKEGGKPRDEERRKAGKGKEGMKESHEGFDTQVRNISIFVNKNGDGVKGLPTSRHKW